MADSSLEAIYQYVYDLLIDDADVDATVTWGPPVGDDKPSEFVAVGFGPEGESGDATREWVNLGAQKFDEDWDLELFVEVAQADAQDLKPAYTRSTALANAVEDALRADVTLGGTVRSARLRRWRGRYFRQDQTRGHRVFLTLSGRTRI